MRPLEGIKVLDLSRLLPGPLASLVLADLGAQVDKVEDHHAGDYLRDFPPAVGTGEEKASSIFLALNRDKRSVELDLKKPSAQRTFKRLVRGYDVVLEQFRPGVLARLGLGHDVLLAENPRLVVCSLTGYGQDGPLADRAGHDLNYLARAGVLALSGPEGAPPQVPGVQLADVSGGLYAVVGILGALRDRDRTGKGRIVDVAMIETAIPFAAFGFGLAFGGHAPRGGAEVITGGIAPYATYATRDGKAVALAALEPKFWNAFCEGAGRASSLKDLVPGEHQGKLKAELAALFATKSRDEWTAFGEQHDCCLEPVLTPDEARQDSHLRERGVFFELESRWGTIPQMRTPLADRTHVPAPPPRRGEHTEAVLREAGVTDAEMAALRSDGAIR